MRYANLAIVLSFLALISACVTSHHPGKCQSRSVYTQLNSNTAIVSFYEDRPSYREQLEKDLIYSCALVTVHDGYDYFIVVGGDLGLTPLLYPKARIRYQSTVSSRDHYPAYSSYSTASTYQAGDIVHDGQAKASVIIKMFKKPRPPELWYAYDARELINDMRSPG